MCKSFFHTCKKKYQRVLLAILLTVSSCPIFGITVIHLRLLWVHCMSTATTHDNQYCFTCIYQTYTKLVFHFYPPPVGIRGERALGICCLSLNESKCKYMVLSLWLGPKNQGPVPQHLCDTLKIYLQTKVMNSDHRP